MGCKKLTYDQEGYRTPFLQIWKRGAKEKLPLFFCDALEKNPATPNFCNDYTPFGLTFNSYTSGTENLYKYNGGSELQNELSVYMTPNRMMDPTLGRFWGIDALADMFTGISPMAFGYNNPLKFNDPTGLNPCENDDCEDTEPTVLPAITVTASRLPSSTPNYSSLLSQLSGSSNPIYRYLGRNYEKGNYGAIDRAFSNKSIHYSYGEELDESLREGKTSDALMMIASRGIGGAMIATYGAPILIETLGTQGSKFALGFGQDVGVQLLTGTKLSEVDYLDATISGIAGPMNFNLTGIGLEGIKAAVDLRVGVNNGQLDFSQSGALFAGKNFASVGIDFGMGTLVGFGNFRMNQEGASKAVIGTINSFSSFGTGLVGSKAKKVVE